VASTLDPWLHVGQEKVKSIISSEPAHKILRKKERTKQAMLESADGWQAHLGPDGYLKVCTTICRLVEKAGGEEDVSEFVARNTDKLLGYLGEDGYREIVGRAITPLTYRAGSDRYKPIIGMQLAEGLVEAIDAQTWDQYNLLPRKLLLESFAGLYEDVRLACKHRDYKRAGDLIDRWKGLYDQGGD
jgi:hypothetical protein